MAITRDFLLANHADLVEAFRAEGREAGLRAGREEGATNERARIKAVFSHAMPGHSTLVHQLAFDGKTTGDQAAGQILAAERAKLGKKAEDLLADAGALADVTATPTADPAAATAAATAELAKLPLEERCKKQWESDAAIRAAWTDLAAYTAFEKAQASGRVRILGKRTA